MMLIEYVGPYTNHALMLARRTAGEWTLFERHSLPPLRTPERRVRYQDVTARAQNVVRTARRRGLRAEYSPRTIGNTLETYVRVTS